MGCPGEFGRVQLNGPDLGCEVEPASYAQRHILPPPHPQGTVGTIGSYCCGACIVACAWMMRALGTMALAGLAWGGVLAGAGQAQEADDPAALNAEVVRLHQAGKHAEATEIA